MGYIVESDFHHNGLRCVCIGLTDMGHRCGYVGIGKDHPLYGRGYFEKILPFEKVRDQKIGKRGIIPLLCAGERDERIGMDVYFDVHGSVTFAGGGKDSEYPVKSDFWWIGFDCGHAGDARDEALCKDHCLKTYSRLKNYGKVRTQAYVEQECRNLADQILEVKEVY